MGVETKGHCGLLQAGVIPLSGQVPGRQSLCSRLAYLVSLFVRVLCGFVEFWLSVV
jgi:hypothetical protein